MDIGSINGKAINSLEVNGPKKTDIANSKCGSEWGGINGEYINSFEINGPNRSNREKCRKTQVI